MPLVGYVVPDYWSEFSARKQMAQIGVAILQHTNSSRVFPPQLAHACST
jgi:hypothetical protein